VAYWYGAQQHLLDIADIFAERDVRMESGPAKHGTTQAYFLYCFEPGGNRVELFGDTGYLIFDPEWKTVVWDVANEVDLEKSSICRGPTTNRSIAIARRSCSVTAWKRSASDTARDESCFLVTLQQVGACCGIPATRHNVIRQEKEGRQRHIYIP
jgi:hypothetical protein